MRTTLSKTVCIIAAPQNQAGIDELTQRSGNVSLTKEQVQQIAMLARLQVDDNDIDEVAAKLSDIVDFVDQLQAVPTDEVVPMAHPLHQTQRLRADKVTDEDRRDEFQANAAAVRDGLYLVPKVID